MADMMPTDMTSPSFPDIDILDVAYQHGRGGPHSVERLKVAIPHPQQWTQRGQKYGPSRVTVPASVIHNLTQMLGREIERYINDMYYTTITASQTNSLTVSNQQTTSGTTVTYPQQRGAATWWSQYDLYYQRRAQGWDPATAPPPSPPKEFNKFINASDLMEKFIEFLGTEKVRSHEVMDMPVELFIKWLVIEAAIADKEEPPVTLELPPPKRQPQCLQCKRFMPWGAELQLDSEACAQRYFAKRKELVAA
jgi:hypothetical protein